MMSGDVRPVSAPQDVGVTPRILWELIKPGVTRLVLITTACGAFIAPGPVDWLKLMTACFGTALVVGAANTLNMYLERDTDAEMDRTRHRPLPSGRLAPEVALWFGIALAGLGLPILALLVNPTSALLAGAAFGSYVFVYTPLKRVLGFSLHVGAVPGAIPPLIGWASMTGRLDLAAWSLFAILFVWQLPHFLAIAIFRQRDYERADLKVAPPAHALRSTTGWIVFYSALLIPVNALPTLMGIAGWDYFALAGGLGVVFLFFSLRGLLPGAGPRWARTLFFLSLPYLVLVYAALVVFAG